MLGLAFITPAYKVFDDIKRRFGSEALCCHSCSPYNAMKEYVSRIQNPLAGIQLDTLFYDIEQFAREAQILDMLPLLKRAALLAQDPRAFEPIIELDEVEHDALHNEVLHKWCQPTALYFTVILCSIGAAVQGWDQTGSGGAWIVDSAGQLFGHIVAGDPMLGLAFIIPAYMFFDDINSGAFCCPSSLTMQPYNTPKNYVSRSDLSVGITQTWAPSRLSRWRMHLASLTFLLLDIPFYLPLANYGMVFIRLGGVGLGTYSTPQTASEILSLPLHLPSANGSIMSICLLQWVALVITYTRGIVLMRTYMSIQSGAEYPLAAIIIRDGHELQTGEIWFFTSLLSAFIASNSGLYVASRALYGKTHLSQHEENARIWNSRHITSPNLTQVVPTRLLQLMLYNDHSEWQRIAQGGRPIRTSIMYLGCWAEQYLQTLEQEVLHRRAGFYRGNLLGTSMIMTGTSNQLMAAAFDATVFSAITPSFGSRVPSMGSYTYIGYNQETTNDAAADRIEEVYKTVVWK